MQWIMENGSSCTKRKGEDQRGKGLSLGGGGVV